MKPRIGVREALAVFALATAWALAVRPGPLSLPYFWDEGDVYAPGARWLATHGFDITPGHFPDDWSRGHPQLFYLVVAVAFRAFGPGPAVGHAVMVPFTALALAATYVLGAERGSRVIGAAAAMLLGATPLFMSMGAQVLPEMPLTALTVVAVVLFSRGQLVAGALVGVALVWIKETGVFTPLAIAGAIFVDAVLAAREGPRWRRVARDVGVSLAPVLALLLFFVWQRAAAGYFVFPHHLDLLNERGFAASDVWTVFPSLLWTRGRWLATSAAVLGVVLALARKRSLLREVFEDPTSIAILLLVLGNAIFFAKMFWLERYALPAHPGVCVLLAALVSKGAETAAQRVRWVALVPLGAAAGLGLLSLHTLDRGAPEQTFAYASVVESHRRAISAVDALPGDPLVVTTWPLTTELEEPWLGFAGRATRAEHPDALALHPHMSPDVVVVDDGSRHAAELRALARHWRLSRRSTTVVPPAPRIEVWAR